MQGLPASTARQAVPNPTTDSTGSGTRAGFRSSAPDRTASGTPYKVPRNVNASTAESSTPPVSSRNTGSSTPPVASSTIQAWWP